MFNTKLIEKNVGQVLKVSFQRLGPTYVKVGQFISSRPDIFGKPFSSVFASLRDKVKPMSKEDVKYVLGNEIEKFSDFNYDPIASASIGQVHKGRLKNGKEVAVKVKRKGIEDNIERDIEKILALVIVMEKNIPGLAPNIEKMKSTLINMKQGILDECDYEMEGRNMVLFRDVYHMDNHIVIPEMLYCNKNVLIMEYITGTNIFRYVEKHPNKAKSVSVQLMWLFLSKMMENGIMHGDPHAGNFGINETNGSIVLYDFGNVLKLPYEYRQQLKELIWFMYLDNKQAMLSQLEKLGGKISNEGSMLQMLDMYRKYLKTVDINELSAMRSVDFVPPIELPDTMLSMIRVYGVVEGICKRIYPDFNYFDLFESKNIDFLLDDEFLFYKIDKDIKQLAADWFF